MKHHIQQQKRLRFEDASFVYCTKGLFIVGFSICKDTHFTLNGEISLLLKGVCVNYITMNITFPVAQLL
jgi:hypothetical protein